MRHITYIAHHGIKGQEWGVRNGPPYPLSEKKHAAVVKKDKESGYTFKNKVKAAIGYYKPGDNNPYISPERKAAREKETEDYEKSKKAAEAKIESLKVSINSHPEMKKLLIGAGIAAGAAFVGYALYKTYNHNLRSFDRGYFNRSLDKQLKGFDVKSLDDLDKIYKKGHIFHRMSSIKMEDLTNAKRIYASVNENDSNRYKVKLPEYFKRWVDTVPGFKYEGDFNNTYQALTDIKSPSAKKRYEYYLDLLKNDNDFRKAMGFKKDYDENYINNFAQRTFMRFVTALSNGDNPAIQKYYKKILDMGYNAIIDDNDLGVLAEEPLIILNPGNVLVNKGIEEIKGLKRFMAVMKLKNF